MIDTVYQFWKEQRMRNVFLALATLCSISAAAQAAPATGYDSFTITDAAAAAMDSPAYAACMKASGGVTVHMRNCGGAEFAKLEKRHDAAFKKRTATLPKAAASKLRLDEKAWQASGYKKCDAPSKMNAGGTLELLEKDSCGHSEIKRRIAWLEQYKQ
jgi:uncharacterized protein YecT (DUF1311 family)